MVGGDHRAPRMTSRRISTDISFVLSLPKYAIIFASSRGVGQHQITSKGERDMVNQNSVSASYDAEVIGETCGIFSAIVAAVCGIAYLVGKAK